MGQAKKRQDMMGVFHHQLHTGRRDAKKEARETKKDTHPNAPMGTETPGPPGDPGMCLCLHLCSSRQRPHAPVNWVASERSNTLPIASSGRACLVWYGCVPCRALPSFPWSPPGSGEGRQMGCEFDHSTSEYNKVQKNKGQRQVSQ